MTACRAAAAAVRLRQASAAVRGANRATALCTAAGSLAHRAASRLQASLRLKSEAVGDDSNATAADTAAMLHGALGELVVVVFVLFVSLV